MPDTALASPSVTGAAPRMGTPANDSASWAGWAISSFTNKISTASGEIRAGTNGDTTQRPSSVPPSASAKTEKPPIPLHSKPGMTLNKSSASIPSIISPDPAAAFNDDAEDFGDDWGGFAEDSKAKEDDDDPWADAAPATSTSTNAFDDKGEPDFAGWLAAQSASKKTTKNVLPKGLTKSTATKTTRPILGGRSATTGSTGSTAKKVIAAPKKEAPKVEAKKSNEDEEEGWGDAW